MYMTFLRKNQSMQIKEITKKKNKGEMLVYEKIRQKQKKKINVCTLTLQRGRGFSHLNSQDVQDGWYTPNVI